MKKHTAVLAGLIAAAGLTGGATLTAQAHPAAATHQATAHHTSQVALTRLHAMLHTPGTVGTRVILPNDGGSASH